MERSEAEAIYDSGRDRCVGVIVELAAVVEWLAAQSVLLEERVRRLEEQTRQSSRDGVEAAVAGSAEDASAAASRGAGEGEGAFG